MSLDKPELYRLKAELCRAFADSRRLMIIDILRSGEITVNEISQMVKLQQAVVSRNLAILRHCGVVKRRREGTKIYYSLTDSRIVQACELVHDILLAQIENRINQAEGLTSR